MLFFVCFLTILLFFFFYKSRNMINDTKQKSETAAPHSVKELFKLDSLT